MEKSVENIHGDIKMDEVEYHLKNFGDQGGCSGVDLGGGCRGCPPPP